MSSKLVLPAFAFRSSFFWAFSSFFLALIFSFSFLLFIHFLFISNAFSLVVLMFYVV